MLRRNEQGISRIILIAGIALVAILVVVGILLAGKKANQKPSNQSASPYLTITEWGVQLPLSEGNRDMYYQHVVYQGELGEGVKIFSKDIDGLKNASGVPCKDDKHPLMVINRVSAGKGIQISNPNLPDYDPNSGPYKTVALQEKYAFGTNKVQDLAPCVNLNNGTAQPFKGDKAVSDKYQAKRSALDGGFNGLGVITAPPTDKK